MRHVFFSFHYEADSWRANLVRNMWVTSGKKAAGFVDSADFESIQRQGDQAIKSWINKQMEYTSVTAFLIGTDTINRKWVKYEVDKSIERGNGLIGIHINQLNNQALQIKAEPIVNNLLTTSGHEVKNCKFYNSGHTSGRDYYNWISANIGNWVETAAKKAEENRVY